MTPSGESASDKRVMVLGVKDAFGRYLESARIVVDVDQLRPGYIATTGRYVLPCEIVDGGDVGFTIELSAELRIIGPPRRRTMASRDESASPAFRALPPELGPPGECAWCCKTIEAGQGWARVTTTVYTPDHQALKEHWRDFHHDPAVYDALTRGKLDATEDQIRGGSPGACLWHGEQ